MIYDMMYRDGANYKQCFRAEISDEIKNAFNASLTVSEGEIEMEQSGMTVGEFFKHMGWSYDPDYDHNILTIEAVSENQITKPDVYFVDDERRKEIVANEIMEETKDFGDDEEHAAVDVPPHYPNALGDWGEWVNLSTFKTKQEAIDWAKKHLGADDNGMICVISTF